jgi:hypothetical protein
MRVAGIDTVFRSGAVAQPNRSDAVPRGISYGTTSTNTISVQAIDSAGNRSTVSSVTLESQSC